MYESGHLWLSWTVRLAIKEGTFVRSWTFGRWVRTTKGTRLYAFLGCLVCNRFGVYVIRLGPHSLGASRLNMWLGPCPFRVHASLEGGEGWWLLPGTTRVHRSPPASKVYLNKSILHFIGEISRSYLEIASERCFPQWALRPWCFSSAAKKNVELWVLTESVVLPLFRIRMSSLCDRDGHQPSDSPIIQAISSWNH